MTGNFERIAAQALGEGRTYLMEHESKRILMDAGLETTGAHLASSADDAVRIANQLGYPVVLKVLSKDVIHKSDAGGVRLNLQDADAVRSAYDEIQKAFRELGMIGVSVQRMASPGIEVIIGVTTDPTFGPVLMFGLGGIFVEILRDVSFRSIPISEMDAESMIREIRGYPLLRGYRGISGDIDAIKSMLLRVSDLVREHSIIKEMDLNPVFVYPRGYTIADARIILDSSSAASAADTAPSQGVGGLRGLFYPQSIAVIGASNTKGKLGWNVFYNLLSHGYKGRLYPVNPNASEVQGVRAYPSIKDVPEAVDVAIVLVPASLTPQVVQDCCAAGVKYVVVESAGFAELGDEGKRIERELLSIVRRHGCRLLGPNCSGIINTNCGVVESIGVVDELNRGNVGLIAQAGVYAAGYLWGLRKVLDFGIIATIGNKLDLNETDMLEAIGMDENIDVVCMYLEDVKGGRRFIDVAREVSRRKPVVVLKTGRTEAGKRAVSSHTASLAGNDEIYSSVFRQAGLIRARDNDHMFALARAFSKQPLPVNDGVFVISYAGSLGVAAADAISMNGMRLAELSPDLKEELRRVLPKYVSGMNPVDFTFDQTPDQVRRTIEIAVRSEDVGSFIVVMQTEMLGSYIDTLRSIDYMGRPVLAVVASKEFVIDDTIKMERAGIPVYSTPEQAAEVLGAMWRYRKERRWQE
ncbi:MAG: acetate--CoA ligase family protein [Methanothrix sp.]|jgi:acyl-CoA synthetase (NDP forming)|uniref:acetate--CoA ligase family protein n=1 Tax=Methanothrix sp. TaxID=90426 RepID=UPI00247E0A03|nr:acetate--CoA ligase family protein [Methanothrix sp.]